MIDATHAGWREARLSLAIGDETARKRAYLNIKEALVPNKSLPDKILAPAWSEYLFFPSDTMFGEGFTEIIGDLLRAENAAVCCLLNINASVSLDFEEIAAIFIDGMVAGRDYVAHLRHGGPEFGWLYGMDRYCCASNVGKWYIYCEKENDIGLIALRGSNISRFHEPLNKLRAVCIEDILKNKSTSLFPFNKLAGEWCSKLLQNYGR